MESQLHPDGNKLLTLYSLAFYSFIVASVARRAISSIGRFVRLIY